MNAMVSINTYPTNGILGSYVSGLNTNSMLSTLIWRGGERGSTNKYAVSCGFNKIRSFKVANLDVLLDNWSV